MASMGLPLEDVPYLPEISEALQLDLEITALVLLAFVLVAFLATLLVARLAFGSKKSNLIVVVGLSGSGKTSLFLKLRDGTVHSGTVTSMEINEGKFPLHSELAKNPKARPMNLVDVPGHPRLRTRVDPYLQRAVGIVFLVDALDFVPHIKDNAEFLYEVLTNPHVSRRKVPVLVAGNKVDKVTANSVEFIRKQLEKELDRLRDSRHASLGMSEGKSIYLGTKGETFKFTQCPNIAGFVEVSVLGDKLSDIESFIRQQVKA